MGGKNNKPTASCLTSLSLYAILDAMEITTMAQAMQLHAQILKLGNPEKTQTQNLSKLITFTALSPLGNLNYARHVFNSLQTPNSYFYNTMIRAYSQGPDPAQALNLFFSMHQCPNPNFPIPDKFTFPFLLKSCTRLKRTQLGKQLHGLIYKMTLDSDMYVQHSLIHMYSLGGESGNAYKVFDRMCDTDVVSWTSMIDGLVDDDRCMEAIRLFYRMVEDGVEANDATVVAVLKACADTGALSVGRRVHSTIEERELGRKANVRTALIDMYAKCGCIDRAMRVFYDVMDTNVFAWTAMISGLASHGRCKDAIDLFETMESFYVKPDERTMTAVLSACRNVGLVSEGRVYFESMTKKYGLRPTIQHYGCIVDLLARAGHLNDAEEFVRKMPIEPDAVLWRTLIWACKVHGDMGRGERLMKQLQEVKSNDCGSYVLLGNVYASAGKWREKARVRESMNKIGLVKSPGSSKIEIDTVIHEFAAGDSSHPEAENIYEKLNEIEEQLKEEGYRPKLSEVLLEMDDEEKAFQLLHHSEKLALAFGLIKTSPGTEIRIVKNLRSCEDCHNVMKLISKIHQREIIIRDRIRFHYFINGDCSCGDYW